MGAAEIGIELLVIEKALQDKGGPGADNGQVVALRNGLRDFQDVVPLRDDLLRVAHKDHPLRRGHDAAVGTVEQRVAEEARTGKATYGGSLGRTRGIIDKETDAEGFYEYSTDYIVPADTDGDGMPDEWEKSVGLDINATDNNRINSDGYTALEVYLASLMGESMSTDFLMSGIENAVVSAKISYDPSTSILTVSPDAIGATLSVYALDGRMIYNRVVTSLESRLPLPSGINLLHLHGRNIAPRMLKISR